MSFVSSFFSGLLCLSGFFLLSLILVVGYKTIEFYIKERFFIKPVEVQQPTASIKRKRKRKAPTPIRSIEIDPQEIDRIYVKKAN